MKSLLPHSAERLSAWLMERALSGVPPLASAHDLAEAVRRNERYVNDEARIKAVVRREMAKTFTAGFVTGISGFITLPIALPANIGAVWLLEARLSACIADLRGYDVREPWVQSSVLLSLTGGAAPELLRQTGVRMGEWAARRVMLKLSDEMLVQINRRVGFRLLATASGKGFIKIGRMVPLAGALVGGSIDATSARAVAAAAKELFPPLAGAGPRAQIS